MFKDNSNKLFAVSVFYKIAFIVSLTIRLNLWINWMELYRLNFGLKKHCLKKKVMLSNVKNVKDSWSLLFVNLWGCKKNQAKVSYLNCSKQYAANDWSSV